MEPWNLLHEITEEQNLIPIKDFNSVVKSQWILHCNWIWMKYLNTPLHPLHVIPRCPRPRVDRPGHRDVHDQLLHRRPPRHSHRVDWRTRLVFPSLAQSWWVRVLSERRQALEEDQVWWDVHIRFLIYIAYFKWFCSEIILFFLLGHFLSSKLKNSFIDWNILF